MRANCKRLLLLLIFTIVVMALKSCTITNEILYPISYTDIIIKYGDEYSIPYELICAVIRTESSFDVEAKSSAGAVGLMQLMPATAEEMASRLKETYDVSMLTDPDTNIRYGCYYLSYLYRNTGENWDTACAAYNAGIGRVKAWLEDEEYSDNGITLKIIPIEETKKYVESINKYQLKYKELYFSNQGESEDV